MVDLERRAEIGREKRARTRAAIIETALQVVRQRGADEPTIEEFIVAADVAKGTFYNHFKTKNELLFAAGSFVADAVDEQILPLLKHIDDPARRIAVAIRTFVRACRERPEWGWMLVRSMPGMHVGWSADMRKGVLADIRSGAKRGRFDVPSVQVAAALGMGTLAMAIQTLLTERTPADFGENVATMTLRAMGMTKEEAERVARLPIDAA